MARPRLFLIDAFGFIFRAYHARAHSSAPPMRTSAGQPTEVVYIFQSMLRRLLANHNPDFVAAVFEGEGPAVREQEYAEYKANRPEPPADLIQQIPWVRRLLEAMRIPVLEHPGYEADDVIGTIARQAVEAGVDVVIVSSDKDLLQLVGDGVFVLDPMKGDQLYDAAKVKERLGVEPAQMPDYLALRGDPTDNIPGAPGIGDKGARELIARFGSVEAALEGAAGVERKTYRESLDNNRDRILMSKRLATVVTGLPVSFDMDLARRQPPDWEALRRLYTELEFFSLLRDPDGVSPRNAAYRALGRPAELESWLASMAPDAPLAVVLGPEGGGLAPACFGLAWRAGEACSAPVDLLDALRPALEDARRPKAAHDAKSLMLALAKRGVELRGVADDVMLYAFLLDADPAGCSLEALVQRRLLRKAGSAPEERADAIIELAPSLRREVAEQGLRNLYETIDLPLTEVLVRMERTGVLLDRAALAELSARMEKEIERLTGEIHALAGHPFNINSPQQLGKVLFEELGLPAAGRQAKGKAPSTAADVLEELAPQHPIAAKVLEYRQLAKLKGTYADALPALIDPATGRLHTSFNPAGTATGRLSSSNPNLQNIPVRTELGRQIRAAFVPRPGWLMLVADYSQIELRLLAHMSGDPLLVEAFRNGEDIHTRTAAEVFGVPPLMVTPELRRNAKAVNFGIIYGLSAFGLAAQLGISQGEAQGYIQSYFERYAGVRRFIEKQIAEVRCSGETRTLFGRRRPIPEINSRNPSARSFAERTAVNTPLQGTAADLIKLAMIRIHREIEARAMRAAMLLQVHDELVFEVPPEEVEDLRSLARREMEGVCRLETPLVVDLGVGANWRDAK